MTDITRYLIEIAQGDPGAREQLFALVYDELRRMAAQHMAREKRGHTLQTTELVHEAYLRLVKGAPGGEKPWEGRSHFFGAAAEAMRRILVEIARRKRRLKHGGGQTRVDADGSLFVSREPEEEVLAVDEALTLLAEVDPTKAELVKQRYFVGQTLEEAASHLGISFAMAKRHWKFAKAWLKARLGESGGCETAARAE